MYQAPRKIDTSGLNSSGELQQQHAAQHQNNYDWRQTNVMQYLEGCHPLKELPPLPPWTEAYNEAQSYGLHESSSSTGTSVIAPLTDSAGSSFSSYSTQAAGMDDAASYNGHPIMMSDSLSTAPKNFNTALTGTSHSMPKSPNANVDSASRWKSQYAQQPVQQLAQPPATTFNSSKPSIFATQESQPLWHTAGFQTIPHVQKPWTIPAINTGQWHGASSLTASMDSRSSQCQYCHKWVSRPSYTQEPTVVPPALQSGITNQQYTGLRSPVDFSLPRDAKLQVNAAVAASEESDHGTAGSLHMQWNVCGSASSRADRSTSQETFISDSTSTSTNADTSSADQVPTFHATPSRASNDDETHAEQPDTAESLRTEHPHKRSKNRDQLDDKDRFLLKARLQGITYREIKATGHFHEAESTLRGRFRCLTKTKTQRVRQPHWTETDLRLLKKAVQELVPKKSSKRKVQNIHKDVEKIESHRVPWKKVAENIADNGGSYVFGSATCRKKWEEIA